MSRRALSAFLALTLLAADALPAGEIVVAQKPVPASLPQPTARLVGRARGRMPDLHHDPHATVALYTAPTVAPTPTGQLDLFDDLLDTVRTLVAEPQPPALTIVGDGSLAHAALAGFVRTLRLEQPKLRVRLLEAPPTERVLLDELGAADGESHLVWRDGQRHAPRRTHQRRGFVVAAVQQRLARRLGERGRQAVESRYNWQHEEVKLLAAVRSLRVPDPSRERLSNRSRAAPGRSRAATTA